MSVFCKWNGVVCGRTRGTGEGDAEPGKERDEAGLEGSRSEVDMGLARRRLERVRGGEGGREVEGDGVEEVVEGIGGRAAGCEGLVSIEEGWKAPTSLGGVGGLICSDGRFCCISEDAF